MIKKMKTSIVMEILIQIVLCSFVVIVMFSGNVCGEPQTIGICAMPACNCSIIVHHWINVKCIFSDYEDIELREGSIPADASEVSVSRCRELRIHSGAFTGGAQLRRVHVTGIHSFVAKRQAFNNISAPNPLLEVSECNKVVLESHAFKNAYGTLSVSISRCKYVEIKPNAFSWLLRFTVREVPTLELSSNAFKFDARPYGRHGPATKITFQSVKISELPSFTFPSAAAEIRMDDVGIKIIRKDAFCAMMILSIKISNASIFEIESGAFSYQTLIPNFELIDIRLKTIKSGAFKAAFTNFTIQYSRVNEIEKGAIESSTATVTLNNNEFHSLEKNSIILKQWSKITIDQNLFVELAEEAIIIDDIAKATPEYPNLEFSFRGNRINKPAVGSLRFASISEKVTFAKVGNNYFEKVCSCLMEDWMRQLSGKNTSVSWMMDSSFCIAGEWLEKCFKVPQGYLAMRNFTNTICVPDGDITCKQPSDKMTPSVSPPSVGPHVYPRENNYFDVEMSDSEQLEREKKLIIIVCVATIFIIVGIILTSGIFYMRRRGVCPKLLSPTINLSNFWLSSTNNGIVAATSARSISRLSINEYAGLRPEATIVVDNRDENPTIIENAIITGISAAASLDNYYAYTENKATQTLPEELTEEYLKELRERLNDPDNYSQARDMIEHLYDLIKVEESCNNNNSDISLSRDEENTYDIIAPRIKKLRNILQPSVDVGTRVPSLEKLLPTEHMMRPTIVDYMEPKDQKTCDYNHLYAELPGDETVPSTSRLSQAISMNLASRAPQPLPSSDTTANHHFTDDNCQSKYSNPVAEDNDYQGAITLQNAGIIIDRKRPPSFFKTFGENILGSKHKKSDNSLLSEYITSNDLNGRLYSELPESTSTTAPAINKMANRPLPVKPDQECSNFTTT